MIFQVGYEHQQLGRGIKLIKSLTIFINILVVSLFYTGGPIASREGLVKYGDTSQGFYLMIGYSRILQEQFRVLS